MKTPVTLAVYTACLFMVNTAEEPTLNRSSSYFRSVNVGESVTLPCVCQKKGMMIFSWYKKSSGQTSGLITTFYNKHANVTFHDPFKDGRFSLDTKELKYHLTISDFRPSDSATYFCIGGSFIQFDFCAVITVNAKHFDTDIQAVIHQFKSERTQPGNSPTLNCTVHTESCDGEHSVYWFRNSEEAHPGLIYTHGGRNDQCERNPHSHTHTCVYSLPWRNRTSAQDGTDHSAVLSCAHILLGDGTKANLKGTLLHITDSHVLLSILASALAATALLIILSVLSLCRMKHRRCRCTADSNPSTSLSRDKDDLQYAALSVHRANRSRRVKDDDTDDDVYSCVQW